MTDENYTYPEPIVRDDEEYFTVERILDERRVSRRLEYLIRWEGYPPSEDLWKDAKEIKVCIAVQKFFI